MNKLQEYLDHSIITGEQNIFSKQIKATSKEVLKLRDDLVEVMKKNIEQVPDMIDVGIDEVVVNLARHGLEYAAGGVIESAMFLSDKYVAIVFCDNGPGYDFRKRRAKSPMKQLEKGATGGYGLFLVKRIFSKIDYTSEKDRNITVLYRKL